MSTYIKLNMLGQPSAVQYETIPDEDLWEDGEINNQKELMDKIEHHLLITGKWKLI